MARIARHPVASFEDALSMAQTYSDKALHIMLGLDASGSMTRVFDGIRSRWMALGENVIALIRRLQSDDLALVARLTIVVFNSTCETILEDRLAAEIDVEELEARLRSIRPKGVTLMGKAVCSMLDMLEQQKDRMRRSGASYYQPIMSIFTDGVPTNEEGVASVQSMSQAFHRIDTLVDADKLTVLPLAIAAKDEPVEHFKVLTRLTGKAETDGIAPVVTSAAEMRKAFRYLGQTAVAATKGGDVYAHAARMLGCRPGSSI